jgi:GT2 family glycosyltransferase
MKIGLVTVLYKSDNVLPDFFKSIAIQTYKNYVLILVDNSASIDTKKIIEELNIQYNLPLLHLEMESNIGVAAANNVGIKSAFSNGCNDILILNNDIVFSQPHCFEELVLYSRNHSIIVPKIYYYNSKTLWYAGGLLRRWFGFVKHIGIGKQDTEEFNISKYTDYAPTCFTYVKKEVFNKVGLMDEKYFVYVDDTDFMYRATIAGYGIWYEPSLFIEHKVSQSTGGLLTDFSIYYDTRNKIYFSNKFNNFFYKMSSNFFVISFAFLFAIKEKRISALVSVKKAVIDGYKMKVETNK